MSTPTPRYEVTSFDVCVPGMERLRNQDEFILVAYVTNKSTRLGKERGGVAALFC